MPNRLPGAIEAKKQNQKDTMKKTSITITSQRNRTRVTVSNGRQATTTRFFPSMAEAIDYVLPRGNCNTPCFINGFKCVLAGWIPGLAGRTQN